jgi:hypothetical protein
MTRGQAPKDTTCEPDVKRRPLSEAVRKLADDCIPYPRWVIPHESWIATTGNCSRIPDYPPPKGINGLLIHQGNNWLVLVSDSAEEAKVTSPRDPPLS